MAAASITTMSMLNHKCLTTTSPKIINQIKQSTKPISSISIPKSSLSSFESKSAITGTAIAAAIFSTLSVSDPAMAVQQIAEIADGDNRGLALLLPLIPAIGWVLFNIFQPALNQINRMRSTRGVIIGLGLGGLAASGLMLTADGASASEIAAIAADASSDNRGTLLLLVVAPAIAWVLYNILQPALNQINRMRN